MKPASGEVVEGPISTLQAISQRKLSSFSTAAITAAAVAAVTISAGIRKHRFSASESSAVEFRSQRRRNKHRTLYQKSSPQCDHPGCYCQPTSSRCSSRPNRTYSGSNVQSSGSSSDSCSGIKPCEHCLETLTEKKKYDCCKPYKGAPCGQQVKENQKYSGCKLLHQYSEAQLPDQKCQVPYSCCALHECYQNHSTPSPKNTAPWAIPVGPYCSNLPSSEYCGSTDRPIEYFRGSWRLANPTTSSSSNCSNIRKKQAKMACNCCNARWPALRTQKVKTLKEAKPRPEEHRVQARRIRHPSEESNSESELDSPVIDVRALRPTSSGSTSSLSLQRTKSSSQYPSAPVQPSSSSSPITPGPAEAYSYPGSFQTCMTNPRAMSTSTNSNDTSGSPIRLPPRSAKCLPSSSSSDSSTTSECPRTTTSTSTPSCNYTDLSDTSSISSNDAIPHPSSYPSALTSYHYQHPAVHLRNPFHAYCSIPYEGPTRSSSSARPISSGDFWNVSRAWPRNRTAPK